MSDDALRSWVAEQVGGEVVRFERLGGGNSREAWLTDVVRGGQPPVPLSVDLKGAKRISLLVDFADRGDELDHADWLDARLVR